MSKHPIPPGKEPSEERSREEKEQTGEAEFGPRMPLVPSFPKAFPWGTPWAHDFRGHTRKPGWSGRGFHSIGGDSGWGGQIEGWLLALSPSP